MHPVDVKPWVADDVSRVLRSRNPLFRPVLGLVLFDLHNHLPQNLALYQHKRTLRNPACFWYARTYVNGAGLQFLSFVVRDTDPAGLEVIWVVSTPP